jgi:ELWxxDGT repeat protein
MSSSAGARAVATFARVLILSATFAICSVGHADTAPHPVRDINQVRVPESSNPQYLGSFNGRVLFGARDSGGAGLWSTDGTAGGTRLISRVDVFAQRNFPGSPSFMVQGGRGFFVGDDASTGVLELWVTDGTSAGTYRLTNSVISATSYSGFLDFIGVLNGRVIFYATDANSLMQVWSSDGTLAGTIQLSQLQAPYNAQAPSVVLGDRFYFASRAADFPYDAPLWVSDGTPQGTQVVQNPNQQPFNSIQALTAVGSLPVFAANSLLWGIDPATETVFPVTSASVPPGYPNQPPVDAAGVASLGGVAFSAGTNMTISDVELWRSDGSPGGTYLLAYLESNVLVSGQSLDQRVGSFLVTVNGHVLTPALSATGNFELMSTDGTMTGTIPLLSVPPPPYSFMWPFNPIGVVNGLVYFTAADDSAGQEWAIWRSDGTVAGTRRTSLPDTPFGELPQLLGVGSRVFVAPVSSDESRPLLVYDPATDSTSTVETALATPYYVSWVAGGGRLYFSVDDPTIGNEPWVSDGTARGTHLIRDVNPEISDYPSVPDQFVNFNGQLAFVADDGVHGRELWTSDGTALGTHLLADVNPGPAGSNPTGLTAWGRDLYFFATDAGGVQRFMRLHAGQAHPHVLASLRSPTTTQPPFNFACYSNTMLPLGGWLYFSASDGISGFELWRTQGTPDTTRRAADIFPGYQSSNPCAFTADGEWLFFSAAGGFAPPELWRSDGTASGTHRVPLAPGNPSTDPADLTSWHGDLYFDLFDGSHGAQVWRWRGGDATADLFIDFAPGNLNAYAFISGTLPHSLLLSAAVPDASGQNYIESLWSTDGTSGNTVLLAPSYNSYLLTLQNQNQALFFENAASGLELWLTDGTPAATHRLSSISSSAQTSMDWLVSFGPGAAFTTHETGTQGIDALWRTDGTPAGTVRVGWIATPTSQSLPGYASTQLLAVGSNLFFVSNTPGTGDELWVYSHCFGAGTGSSQPQAPCSSTKGLAARGYGTITSRGHN